MDNEDQKLVSDLRAAAQYLHDRRPNPSKPPEHSLYMRAAARIEALALKNVTPTKEKSNGKQAPTIEQRLPERGSGTEGTSQHT